MDPGSAFGVKKESLKKTNIKFYTSAIKPECCPAVLNQHTNFCCLKPRLAIKISNKIIPNAISVIPQADPELKVFSLMIKRCLFILFIGITMLIPSTHAEEPNVSVMFNSATGSIQGINADKSSPIMGEEPTLAPSSEATIDIVPPLALASNKKTSASIGKTTTPVSKTTDDGEANVFLNFEDVSLNSVVNYLAERKKINLVPHKDLEALKVSLSTRKPLTLNRAWNVLLTLLEMNGFSIVQVDNLHRIVANKDNGVEPLPYYTSQITAPEDLPDSDLVVRYMYFFKNIKPEMAQEILKSMLDGDKSVQPIKDLQAVIIKEKCHNIKAALRVIKELDTGGLRQSIRIVPLKEADAETVQKLFQDILGGGEVSDDRLKFIAADSPAESAYFSSTTKIIPDSSKNSLILLGTPANIDKICNFIYKYIDVPIGSADSRIHIRELRYAKAESLKPLLESIIKPPSGQGSDKSSVVGQFKFFEDVIIAADAAGGDENRGAGNRLIISANQSDWVRLNSFIDQLDKPAPQVAFEVLIVDISLKMDKELGSQLQTQGMVGAGLNRVNFNNISAATKEQQETYEHDKSTIPAFKFTDIIAGFGTTGSYMTLGTPGVGEANKMWALIRSFFNTNNSHIISQPYLITNNYQECSITVGNTQRVPGPLVTEKGEAKTQQQVEKQANTEVKLTPQINYDGVVTLKLDMTINEFVGSGPGGPDIAKRTISTKVNMAAGEVLVLGGMTKSNLELNTFKTPILGDIPILGNLFRSSVKKKDEVNLYVFIRPSVIKPSFEGAPDEYTQLKLDYAKYQMIKNDDYSKEHDPVHRWFFKPTNHSIKNTLADARNGVFRPVDNFTYGKGQPKTVDIKYDRYYQAISNVEVAKKLKKLKSRKKKQAQ
jgi:general secretion pathway protein D